MARPVVNREGEEGDNNYGSLMKIAVYRRIDDIDVYFPEYNWTMRHTRYQAFKEGQIKCPYEPRHYGVGYIGDGEYNFKNHLHCYNTWIHMLSRCYSDIYQAKRPSYIGCEVCDEWLNYQNFAEWYYDNYYELENEIMNLDKDILYKYNKIYSPETCIFVPQSINSLFIKSDAIRGELPIGVSKRSNKYQARCCDGTRNRVCLGMYDTPEEAFYAYKEYKERLIKEIADNYKNEIPVDLYEAMYKYEVDIND